MLTNAQKSDIIVASDIFSRFVHLGNSVLCNAASRSERLKTVLAALWTVLDLMSAQLMSNKLKSDQTAAQLTSNKLKSYQTAAPMPSDLRTARLSVF